ncbi:UPF0562 C7orf55 [Schistosoma japonicum]|nr:UPF0562 C7orf55 [Schistosoma japonicum]
MTSRIQLFRSILRELRHNRKDKKAPFCYSPEMQCSRENEKVHLAETYLNYLQNKRKLAELVELYKTKEKTIEEAAKMVGLALPKKDCHDQEGK